MDVDRVSVGKLTQQEREECRRKGLCFYCRKQGHMATQCPEKGQKQTRTRATITEVALVTPTPVATPLKGASSRVAAIKALMDEVPESEKDEVFEGLMREGFV